MRPRTNAAPYRLALFVLLVLVLTGCAAPLSSVKNSPTTSTPRIERPEEPPAETPAEVNEAPTNASTSTPPQPGGAISGGEGSEIADGEAAAGDEEQSIEDGAPVDEPVSESPLDELGTVKPELTDDELAEQRHLATAMSPTFDIPMEINDKVLAWVDLYSERFHGSCQASLVRSGRYMEMFRRIFAEEGLPQDLVYMAHVESGYKTTAYSRAHARGVFQFIAPTARTYGLRVDAWVDERSDPEKSARAAAVYMKKLHADFGDWYLALAAYNAGEGKIGRALAATGHADFWSLAETHHIKRETKNHVPAVLAAALISKQPEKYGFAYVPEAPIAYDSVTVEGAVDLRVLARCAGEDFETLVELNPALRRHQTPPAGRFDVRVPPGRGADTLAALERIPASQRVLYASHQVRRGDTLSQIARRYGVSVGAIQATNGLGRRTVIHSGQRLRIPTSARVDVERASVASASRSRAARYHQVRRGETLTAIAQRYGTTPESIAAQSGISPDKVLLVGQRLSVGTRESASQGTRHAAGPGAAPKAAPKSVASVPKSSKKMFHTVRSGETLWKIAARYGTSVAVLCALNQLVPGSIIHPGTRLAIGYR